MKTTFIISSNSDRPSEECSKLIYRETEAERLNVLLIIWKLVNDVVTNKILVSQAYSNFLCAAPHIPPHCQHTLLLFILDCSLLFLWVIFLCQYVFFLKCSVSSLSNTPRDSGNLIFVSLANMATSDHYLSSVFPITNDNFLCLFLPEEKMKRKTLLLPQCR